MLAGSDDDDGGIARGKTNAKGPSKEDVYKAYHKVRGVRGGNGGKRGGKRARASSLHAAGCCAG